MQTIFLFILYIQSDNFLIFMASHLQLNIPPSNSLPYVIPHIVTQQESLPGTRVKYNAMMSESSNGHHQVPPKTINLFWETDIWEF